MAIVKKRIPGFQDGGNAVEPTTGNEVPVGSLPNEVADDIPAQLSEGEFVLPADVVRFIGLERLMKMRDEAKEGLRRMAEIGQMGNAEAVGEKADDSFEEEDEGFESTIDDIMSEVDTEEQTQQAFAKGGAVGGPEWLTGYDMKKAPKNPVFDVRYFRHSDGRMMYVTFYNGRPMTPIPDGFTQTEGPVEQQVGKEAEEKEKVVPAPAPVSGEGGDATPSGPGPGVVGTGPGGSITADDLAVGTTVTPASVKGAAFAASLFTGLPFSAFVNPFANEIAAWGTNQSGVQAGKANQQAMADQLGIPVDDPMVPFAIDELSMSLPASGGAAAAAAAAANAAASAADAAGFSAASQAAAAQAAADAVASGSSAAEAATSGASAAAAQAAAEGITGQPGMEGISSVGSPGIGDSGIAVGDTVGYGGAGDVGGFGFGESEGESEGGGYFAKGGVVQRRKQPAKKQKRKGLASR